MKYINIALFKTDVYYYGLRLGYFTGENHYTINFLPAFWLTRHPEDDSTFITISILNFQLSFARFPKGLYNE